MSVPGQEVVRCNRRLPVNFRYDSLATEIARRRNMSPRAKPRHHPLTFVKQFGLSGADGDHV